MTETYRAAVFLLLLAALQITDVLAERREDADVEARNFSEYCRGELSPERRSRFHGGLAQAEHAVAAGNAGVARAALQEARAAAYRGGREDSNISVKCFGRGTADRWLSAELAQQRLEPEPALYTTAADQGATGLVERIEKQPARRFQGSLATLKRLTEGLEADREFGAFLLPREVAIFKASADAIRTLEQIARKRRDATLAEEERLFTRPITERERAAAESLTGGKDFISAMTGIEMDVGGDEETLAARARLMPLMELLREARAWNPDSYTDEQARPSSQRARKRGDAMLALANDASRSLNARDRLYSAAIAYYEFGGWTRQTSRANSARNAIQADLKTQQARQQAEMDKALQKKRRELEQARKSMTKSEAEKQRFREEADSLESELGL